MTRGRTLAIVQAGGSGGRMDVLTRECAKPALPFAGVYQLVDFPLSNLSHSGIDDVWLSVQFQAGSLQKQVANGRPWDLDRNTGGFRLLMPEEGTGSPDEQGFASGNADELFRIRDDIAAQQPDLLIVCSADHVYRFDFSDAIATHRRKGAECTVVTSQVPRSEASDHATVVSNRLGRVTDFAYKPSRPRTSTVATEIFVYEPEVLFDVLGELHREKTGKASAEETGLGDFGDHLLPALVERGRVFEHPMSGYWRDVGKPLKYLAAHRDLLRADVGLFDDPRWPILSQQPQLAPARIHDTGLAEDCLVSPGVQLHGAARRSVLGPGVVVEEDACVEDSVIFADVVVGHGAVVAWSIVDSGCRVLPDAHVGEQWSGDSPDDDRIVLMGRDCSVAAGQSVPAGSRLEPGTTV